MPRALEGRPGGQVGTLKEKTVHAALTKQRIHAIVGQVIDELEQRRARGKSDYVAKLADEIEQGGLSAWKSLRDLLPPGDPDPTANPGNSLNIGQVFIAAAIKANELEAKRRANAAPVIDATAEPLMGAAADAAGAPEGGQAILAPAEGGGPMATEEASDNVDW